jgi:purine-binding chemotaxis protein CheW
MSHPYILFTLDKTLYALPLAKVEQVIHAVELTPLPEGAHTFLGLVNIQERIVPVINIREILGLSQRDMMITDRIILSKTSSATVSFVADSVVGLVNLEKKEWDDAAPVFARDNGYLAGVAKYESRTVMMIDIEKLFSGQNTHQINRLAGDANAADTPDLNAGQIKTSGPTDALANA